MLGKTRPKNSGNTFKGFEWLNFCFTNITILYSYPQPNISVWGKNVILIKINNFTNIYSSAHTK